MKDTELDIVEIGRLGKPYGFSGAIHVYLNDDVELLEDPDFLFISIEGLPVPFKVVEHGVHNGTRTVTLDRVDSKEGIEKYKNASVFVESVNASLVQSETNILVGFTVFDQSRSQIGVIYHVIEQDPLIFLNIKAVSSNKEIVIPYHEELILDVNHSKRTLTIEIADGLLDL